MTDFERSYAIFTYYCGDIEYADNDTVIGFSTDDGLSVQHDISLDDNAQSIACLNIPDSPWVNVLYGISISGKFQQGVRMAIVMVYI